MSPFKFHRLPASCVVHHGLMVSTGPLACRPAQNPLSSAALGMQDACLDVAGAGRLMVQAQDCFLLMWLPGYLVRCELCPCRETPYLQK